MDPYGLSLETLLAFALTATILELTPGPNMTWLAIVAVTEGRKAGLAAVAGVALGLAAVGLAAALGLAALIAATPLAYQVLRWAGVLYLFWLAWDGWRGAPGAADGPDADGLHLGVQFRRGLITNLLNPKAAVFYVAVLPGFLDPGAQVLAETLTLTLIYVAVATAIHAGIVTAAGTARIWLEDPAREQTVRRVLSVALALVALWFAWKTRG